VPQRGRVKAAEVRERFYIRTWLADLLDCDREELVQSDRVLYDGWFSVIYARGDDAVAEVSVIHLPRGLNAVPRRQHLIAQRPGVEPATVTLADDVVVDPSG
jgi:hypothetical protein